MLGRFQHLFAGLQAITGGSQLKHDGGHHHQQQQLMLRGLQDAALPNNETVPFIDVGEDKVLLIGNSYTFYNELPYQLQEILREGVDPEWGGLKASSDTKAGRAFSAVWQSYEEKSRTYEYLNEGFDSSGVWRWMIMQDQSQVPGFWEEGAGGVFEQSKEAAIKLNNALIENGPGQTMFFMTCKCIHSFHLFPIEFSVIMDLLFGFCDFYFLEGIHH